MPRYHYRVRNKKGEIISGLIEAGAVESAQKTLADNGWAVISIAPQKGLLDYFNPFNRIGVKQKSSFTRQLATMVGSGLPLAQGLQLLNRGERNKNMKRIIGQLVADLEGGYSFSTAISRHPNIFSKMYINAIRAGEATGKLDIVLKQLADTLESERAAGSKMRSAMIYPSFIITSMVIVSGIMMVKVIPVLSAIFEEAKQDLPVTTRMLIALSYFITSYWWIMLLLTVASITVYRIYMRTEQGRNLLDKIKTKIYFINRLNEMFFMARFNRILSMLINAGVPLVEAMQITADAMGNTLYSAEIERSIIQIERGVALSISLNKSKIFPPLVSQMILVGEQTGKLDKVLAKLGDSYEEEYNNVIKGMNSLIEPVIIVFLALGVAFIVFSILMPIYQISTLQ